MVQVRYRGERRITGSVRHADASYLNEHPEHVRLGEPLDDPVAAEVQDCDAGQDDGRSGGGHAHELLDVMAGHGEPDGAHVAVPEHLVEGELQGVEGAEDALVE